MASSRINAVPPSWLAVLVGLSVLSLICALLALQRTWSVRSASPDQVEGTRTDMKSDALSLRGTDAVKPDVLSLRRAELGKIESAERRLARYSNIVAYGAAAPNSGCVTLSIATTSLTLSMNSTACNNNRCPPCFIITNANDYGNYFQLNECSTMKLSNTVSMTTDSMLEIFFLNTDASGKSAVVKDGAGMPFVLRANAAASALCYGNGQNSLHWFGPSDAAPARFALGASSTIACLAGVAITSSELCRWASRTGSHCYKATVPDSVLQHDLPGALCPGTSFSIVNNPLRPPNCFYEDTRTNGTGSTNYVYNTARPGAAWPRTYPVCMI